MLTFSPAPGEVPGGLRIYAVGDVHGCLDSLVRMHEMIESDLTDRPVDRTLLIHLGDYVDRGPDSAGVVGRLAAGEPLPRVPTINLKGNHEALMHDALTGDRPSVTDWLHNGGREALISWGLDPDSPAAKWRVEIPEAHLDFVADLALSHRVGSYLFVHAGIRPGVPLELQSAQDMLTIRQRFLSSDADFGAVIVHGHTPVRSPEIKPNRIGIDTGAVFGGKLTCAVLEGATIGFLQT